MEQDKLIPLRLEDIEEFTVAGRIPRHAITQDIINGIRQLNEKTQLEPFLREILPDPTNTPHTSTEVADILTTHVTHSSSGQPLLAAFVNKGKSYSKVTSEKVAHQMIRLQQIPPIGVIVLLAVGDIHDSAKQSLIVTAKNMNADYMIVDAVDVARLFIAYQKVCPKDGSPYKDGACRKCGTLASVPLELILKVFETPRYTKLPFEDEDISNSIIKQYKAHILTDPHYSKAILREVIKKATWDMRKSTFYGSAQAEERFGENEADGVYLYVYVDTEDVPVNNWICRTCWLRSDLDLPPSLTPSTYGDEWLADIQIDWRKDYEQTRAMWSTFAVKKDAWTRHVEKVLPEVEIMIRQAARLLDEYRSGKLGKHELQSLLVQMQVGARRISEKAMDQGLPPFECQKCSEAFDSMIGDFDLLFLPFMPGRQVPWSWEHIQKIMHDAIESYEENRNSFAHEWRGIGKRWEFRK